MKRQRGFVWIIYLVLILAISGAAYGVWWEADHWCNSACEKANTTIAERDATIKSLETKIAAAADEERRVRVAWAQDSVRAQSDLIQLKGEHEARFRPIYQRARSLPAADAGIRIPASAVGVLNDAVSAANASIAAAAGGIPRADAAPATDSTVEAVTLWGTDNAEKYGRCVVKLTKLVAFYDDLRAKGPHEHEP